MTGKENHIRPQENHERSTDAHDDNAGMNQSDNTDDDTLARMAAQDAQNDMLKHESFLEDPDEQPHTHQNEPSADQIRIQLLEDENARIKDHMVRALADAENTRKRAIKEREDASKFAVSSFAKDILNVADNLRRALDVMPKDQAQQNEHLQSLINGIEATERELLRAFEKNGIQKVEPHEELFDPNFHEVMFEAPIPDKPAGTIIQVLEPGYVLNGRILRPARVGIARNDDSTPPDLSKSSGQNINTEV